MKKLFNFLFGWLKKNAEIERVQSIIHDEEIKFQKWAFGKPISEFSSDYKKLLESWNNIHFRELFVKESDIIHESLSKMRQLYHEQKNGKHTSSSSPSSEVSVEPNDAK